ncbi:hypothetical protein CEP54_009258 [Fusarium duplospermum]|uniref:Uncharacterized protein n=1 Tax=Fusarium duplospermum TaxID=1325734 RepID=A0A428PRH9_9HYPO|nr:hypothetical protein CEP54_009258 [Fusarium duplospermum]
MYGAPPILQTPHHIARLAHVHKASGCRASCVSRQDLEVFDRYRVPNQRGDTIQASVSVPTHKRFHDNVIVSLRQLGVQRRKFVGPRRPHWSLLETLQLRDSCEGKIALPFPLPKLLTNPGVRLSVLLQVLDLFPCQLGDNKGFVPQLTLLLDLSLESVEPLVLQLLGVLTLQGASPGFSALTMRFTPASPNGLKGPRLRPDQREEMSVLLLQAIPSFGQLPDLVVQPLDLLILSLKGIPLGFQRLLDASLRAVRLTGGGLAHGAGDSVKLLMTWYGRPRF